MRAVAVAGLKKSGKTSLMGLLAEALERQGHSVAIIKYSHRPLDIANSDTFWLMRQGRTVVAASPEETALFRSRSMPLGEMLPMLGADVLLVEGGENRELLPRILCLRDGSDEEWNALESHDESSGDDAPLLAVLGPGGGDDDAPYFEELTPESADALAALILKHGKDLMAGSVCVCGPAGVQVSAGGSDVALHPEAARELTETVNGALRQCQGVTPGQEILIRFVAG